MQNRNILTIVLSLSLFLLLESNVFADILVSNGTDILRLNPDGSNPTTLISGASGGMFYDVADQYLYYVGPSDSIMRANRNGSNPISLVSSAGTTVVDLVVDHVNNKIIWTDQGNARIRRADQNGSNVENLVQGVS